MELYLKLFDVLFPVFFVIGVGYYLGVKDPKFDTKFITAFAGNFGLPAIIFYSLTSTNISMELFLRFSYYITLYVLIFAVIGVIILKILNKDVSAIIIEPVQGGTNFISANKKWLEEIRKKCTKYSIEIIFDEIQTGFGRTGKMFACEHENVLPDLLCLAKGLSGGYLPLAATMVKESIFEAFLGGEETTFYYGHSYSGNPLGCAAALASLNIFEEDKVLKKLESKIECLKTGLSELKYKNPLISEVRQIGLISGIEISSELGIIGPDICHLARNYGLLTRSIGNVIVFMPPLIIDENQIYESLNAIESAIIEYQGN